MSNNVRYLSEIERYEIININDGEKYSGLINNDVIIDEEGKLKYLIVNLGGGKFNLFNSDEYLEIEWENVKRIGAKTIILDVDSDMIKKLSCRSVGILKIVVQKFGGTSVSTKERRTMVVEKVKGAINKGYLPVVVVSAMGRKGEPYATDTLLGLVSEEFKKEIN